MKKLLIVLFGLCVLSFSFAQIGLSPSSFSEDLVGGDSITESIVVTNNFGNKIRVGILTEISNDSGDLNGFSFSLSDNEFELEAGISKTIYFTMSVVTNIAPEKYSVKLTAFATEELVDTVHTTSEVEKIVYRSSGGGGGGFTRTVYRTTDNNVLVEVFPGDYNQLIDNYKKTLEDLENKLIIIGNQNKSFDLKKKEIKGLEEQLLVLQETESKEEYGIPTGMVTASDTAGDIVISIFVIIIAFVTGVGGMYLFERSKNESKEVN